MFTNTYLTVNTEQAGCMDLHPKHNLIQTFNPIMTFVEQVAFGIIMFSD